MQHTSFAEQLHRQRYKPIVLMRGSRKNGSRFFAYVEMTYREYERLLHNPALFTGPSYHGTIVLEGDNEPTESDKAWMEEHYNFNHSPA